MTSISGNSRTRTPGAWEWGKRPDGPPARSLWLDHTSRHVSDDKTPYTWNKAWLIWIMPSGKQACIGKHCKSGKISQQQIRHRIISNYFAEKYHELNKDEQTTACTSGFHQVNITEHVMGEVSDAIEQLTMTATTDKNTIE
eukprot:3723202-Ditylum_brightwellii.AAC.1